MGCDGNKAAAPTEVTPSSAPVITPRYRGQEGELEGAPGNNNASTDGSQAFSNDLPYQGGGVLRRLSSYARPSPGCATKKETLSKAGKIKGGYRLITLSPASQNPEVKALPFAGDLLHRLRVQVDIRYRLRE